MGLIATPARRRMAMAFMLSLAVSGGLIRHYAAPASTLHDVGTLLLVMWLPAVGNLIGWLIGKLPRRAPPPAPDFPAGSAFQPQLVLELERVALPPGWPGRFDPSDRRATVLVGRSGFTVRMAGPVAQWLAGDGAQRVPVELLRPDAALRELAPGTAVHLLVGTTAVARGQVLPDPAS